jgi:hypothetical protein
MRKIVCAATIAGVALIAASCGGSAAGTCSSDEDVGRKVSALSDDLEAARQAGKIDAIKAGEISSRIVTSGMTYSSGRDHKAFCEELDRIRKEAGL